MIQTSLVGVNRPTQPDITLILDVDGIIRDASASGPFSGETVKTWLGRPWTETVAAGGIEKARQSINEARGEGVSAYRKIPQRFPSGLETPIEYTTVRLAEGGGLIAIGRNLQASSELQSRLVAAQQAMERDYWKLREIESRYRLLFDGASDAMIVLSSGEPRVTEANPAAIRALGMPRGWDFQSDLPTSERGAFQEMLARARETGRAPGGVFHIGADQAPWILRASLMNDDEGHLFMIQLVPVEPGVQNLPARDGLTLSRLLSGMPDGFVVLDLNGVIQSGNPAFLDMVQASSEAEVTGRDIADWLCRPEVDAPRLLSQLRREGPTRLFATTLRGGGGRLVEVEISAATDARDDATYFAAVVRDVGDRAAAGASGPRVSNPAPPPLLTDGPTPLKALVRAAVDVVERHYVESALKQTDGNRTAAAERLGLSRQGLYAKLDRYGLSSGAGAAFTEAD